MYFFSKKFFIIKKILIESNKNQNNNKLLLTECVDDSIIYTYSLLIHASKIKKIFNSNILVIDNNFSFVKKILYKLFGIKKILYINSLYSLRIVFDNYHALYKEFKKIEGDIETIIKYKYKDVEIGNIAYDDYLRYNMKATVKDLVSYKYYVFKSLICTLKLNKIFSENKFNYYAGKETQFTPRAHIFQNCLLRKIPCYISAGTTQAPTIRKYLRFSQRHVPRIYINRNLFLNIKKKYHRLYLYGDELIKKKFNNILDPNDYADSKYVFNQKDNNFSKLDIFKALDLDPDKKLIIVFAHNFYDGAFEVRKRLFLDNYIWLRETISLLSSNKNINILIKKHPTEKYNLRMKNVSFDIYKKFSNNKKNSNIRIYPENLHPKFIVNYAHAIVSGHGSAGSEYSCFGIPSVICNEAPYSSCKFVHQCNDLEIYKNILNNIHSLEKLSQNKIQDALLYFFIANKLIKNSSDFFDFPPEANFYDIEGFKMSYEFKYFEKILNKIDSLKDMTKSEIFLNYKEFILSGQYTMIDKYQLKLLGEKVTL
jgi:hypothetical protein